MSLYESAKKILFKLDPEVAHTIAERALWASQYVPLLEPALADRFFITHDSLTQELFGKRFLNPIGVAAGFDKNATMVHAMMMLGFGYTEVGTVTPKPQSGNAKPRLFRHIEKESLQNGMGFNNNGSYAMQQRLKKLYMFATPIGVNLGKNKTTPQESAIDDYAHLVKAFNGMCDYFVINISSPNTPNLRDLQNEEFIGALFGTLLPLTNAPILLKIAPDMSEESAIALCQKAISCGAKGIVATNTTTDYSLIPGAKDFGGLSGQVLREKSYAIFKTIAKELFGKTTLISVGGVDDAVEAYRRIKAGASLVQVYTAFIYKGWDLARDINLGLIELLKNDGFSSIKEAIGADLR